MYYLILDTVNFVGNVTPSRSIPHLLDRAVHVLRDQQSQLFDKVKGINGYVDGDKFILDVSNVSTDDIEAYDYHIANLRVYIYHDDTEEEDPVPQSIYEQANIIPWAELIEKYRTAGITVIGG